MNRNKQRGTALETLAANGFASVLDDDRIMRAPLRGANDRGDIANLRCLFGKVVCEVKNHSRLDLSGWVDESHAERGNADAVAAFVLHKRRGKGRFEDQYVTMSVADLLAMVWGVEPE